MKKRINLAIFIGLLTCITCFASINSPNTRKVEMTGICSNPHLTADALDVYYYVNNEVLTVDFAEHGVEYSVTVTNLSNNIYITFYDTGGVVPLPADGFSDYLITIETTDGDVFEGILYASDYVPHLNPWI